MTPHSPWRRTCGARPDPRDPRFATMRLADWERGCELAAGHDFKHLIGGFEWRDEDVSSAGPRTGSRFPAPAGTGGSVRSRVGAFVRRLPGVLSTGGGRARGGSRGSTPATARSAEVFSPVENAKAAVAYLNARYAGERREER